ncbi:MAG: signal peptidase I [Ilumatobacter sp.]|uniref:signal peptidase I n=1 Tax=Ilumatobacter sp. TaxID=1967498 RepID=UPI00260E2F1A|nr:signal peptidase I [Ilumatobacter sp.]MDJ0767822.1 signal peptidase I [Ilumatobacter sp.]
MPQWLTVLCIVGGALAAVVLSIPFVVSTWVVEGDSMAPTLHAGERIVINKLAGDPSLGDVIVHRVVTPGGRRHDYVKRVVAVGGDTVSYLDCVLHRNGSAVDEPYVLDALGSCGGDLDELVVPDGHVTVLGDNRADSVDSRVYGPIPNADVAGTLWFRL